MHSRSVAQWQHPHAFLADEHGSRERRTWIVVGITAAMMAGEIAGGVVFGSMALLADGWHMSTHAGAIGIAALAYLFARRHSRDSRFSFGPGKVGELAGFASAIVLGLVAALIAYESVLRLYSPVVVRFNEAIMVATLGLAVNLASAWLLGHGHKSDRGASEADHHHEHGEVHAGHGHAGHEPGHKHAHTDHNLRAAYMHVLADALTSVLAIIGLLTASFFGWVWIDPVVGIFGAGVIAFWSYGLIRSSAAVLLDTVPDRSLFEDVRRRLERGGDKLADLHIWRVGPGHNAVLASIVSDCPQDPEDYKARLSDMRGLSHVTVEVHACPERTGGLAAG